MGRVLNLWLNKIDRAGVAMVNDLFCDPWAGVDRNIQRRSAIIATAAAAVMVANPAVRETS
jgi:hypothetical protein